MEAQGKRCTGCGEEKPAEAFGWRDRAGGTRKARCRTCVLAYQRRWYIENDAEHRRKVAASRRRRYEINRGIVLAAKQVPCADCDRRCTPIEMDFDHVRGTKVDNVSSMVWHASPARVRSEIAKCEVVCAVCHRERSRARREAR